MSTTGYQLAENPLPVGMAEFNAFAERIITAAGQFADYDSMKWALANMILHADNNKAAFSDQYFIDRLRKAAANQVASAVFQEIKTKQAEAAAQKLQEEQSKTVEATTALEVVSDEKKD